MSSTLFAPSTRVPSAERWSFLSPPPMALSDFNEARPPMPTDATPEYATTNTQCRLVRGQRQVKPRNRDRRPEYRPLIDGGANFQCTPEDDNTLKLDTTPGPGHAAGEFQAD
ncbi:hypothetical protein VTO73DRAFT_4178 [Trametes versicolor]